MLVEVQVRQLSDTLPDAVTRVEERVRENSFGGWVIEQVEATSGDPQEQILEQATSAAWKTLDGLVAVAIILFTGLYLAA